MIIRKAHEPRKEGKASDIPMLTAIEKKFPHLVDGRNCRDIVLLPDDDGPRGWIRNSYLYEGLDEFSPDIVESLIYFVSWICESQSEPVTPFVVSLVASRLYDLANKGEDFTTTLRDYVVSKNGDFARD